MNLGSNKLSGKIPAELGQLANLTELNLSSNKLCEAIPPEIGQLSNLKWLELGENDLSRAIPPEIGQLAQLRWLRLNGNKLSGKIPVEIGQLSNLVVLELHENKLSGKIPATIGELANLGKLRLNGNKLSREIPTEISQLSNLAVLELGENDLSWELLSELRRRNELGLNDANDELAKLIATGETKTVEFKSTLRVNLHTGEHDKEMGHEVLKNIAAFLNTDGGTLIIGVDNDGQPLGLDYDGFRNEDEMGQHLGSIVSDQIGANVWGNISPEFTSYKDKRVLVIHCEKSSFPVYVGKGKDEEFYIRTGPGARPLFPSEIQPYINSHFEMSAPPAEEAPADSA